jgi:glycosyltransferase involved in cell wall biosynthesis
MKPKQPLHVLLLPSWYPRSVEDTRGSFFREQALSLRDSGLKVGVISAEIGSLRKLPTIAQMIGKMSVERDNGVLTLRAKISNITPRISSLNSLRLVRLTRKLYKAYVALEGRPDVIHVHSLLYAGAGALDIFKKNGVPFVVSEHSTAFVSGQLSHSDQKIAESVSKHSAANFAVSSNLAEKLNEKLGLCELRFGVMPNPVSRLFLQNELQTKSSGTFLFFHVSILNERKSVTTIIEAFAAAFGYREGIALLIGGEGTELPQLMIQVENARLGNQVSFVGKMSRLEVREAMGKSNAFVLASKHETFGVVLVEALAMGLPVISTRCGGPQDIVTEQTGILVPVGDVKALSEAMLKIYNNVKQYDSSELRNYCVSNYDPTVIAAKWQTIYNTVLDKQ